MACGRVHYLQFPEGVLNRHYEKLVQCDPRLKALVEGTLSGSGGHYESSESGVEGQPVLQQAKARGAMAMAHVYEGLNEGPPSPYSHVQGRGGGPGVVPEWESELMRSNETSSPSSGRHLVGMCFLFSVAGSCGVGRPCSGEALASCCGAGG